MLPLFSCFKVNRLSQYPTLRKEKTKTRSSMLQNSYIRGFLTQIKRYSIPSYIIKRQESFLSHAQDTSM